MPFSYLILSLSETLSEAMVKLYAELHQCFEDCGHNNVDLEIKFASCFLKNAHGQML